MCTRVTTHVLFMGTALHMYGMYSMCNVLMREGVREGGGERERKGGREGGEREREEGEGCHVTGRGVFGEGSKFRKWNIFYK